MAVKIDANHIYYITNTMMADIDLPLALSLIRYKNKMGNAHSLDRMLFW